LDAIEAKIGIISADSPVIRDDALYTPSEAASLLRCGKTNVYDLIESGLLAVCRIGTGSKGYKVRGSDLQAFMDSRVTGGPRPAMTFKHLRGLG
jgi:excisionase family DNA binding protein